MNKPSVLFVCVHNAGRSQMAAAFLTHFAQDRIEVRSAGSEPAKNINPTVVAAMAELEPGALIGKRMSSGATPPRRFLAPKVEL